MNTKMFAEAISEVDDRYYEEAACYERKRKNPVWLKWGAAAACFVMAAALGLGIWQLRSREDVAVLENGERIVFVRSRLSASSQMAPDIDFDAVSRELTGEELDRLFPGLSVTAYAYFNTVDYRLEGLEGRLGRIKLVISEPGFPLLDTVIEGSEETSEVGGIPVTAGFFLTGPNSKGIRTAIYYAYFRIGGNMVYVENAGAEAESEDVKNELADMIEALVRNGGFDMPQF